MIRPIRRQHLKMWLILTPMIIAVIVIAWTR